MKWKNIGIIFNPIKHDELKDYCGYAQSPQALPLKDRIRIYFSIRKLDLNNQFLSYVHYVDFNLKLTKILEVSQEPVISLGELGTFDEHGIFPFSPLEINNRICAYTCGWSRRISVPVETSIGFVVSNDQGKSFKRIGKGPILSSSINQPYLVGDAFVRRFNDIFYMWYIHGTKWIKTETEDKPERVYKIAYATSEDGINFKPIKSGIIEDSLGENECQALPTVAYFKGQFWMIFCYRDYKGFRNDPRKSYKLACATSNDLVSWTRRCNIFNYDNSSDTWDSKMNCYPNLINIDDNLFLLYNGNEFGKYGFGLAVLEQ